MSLVKTQSQGPIFEIIMNRGDRLNALVPQMFDELIAACDEAANKEYRAVIFRGEGKGFCVGGDIQEFAKVDESSQGIPTEMPDRLHLFIEKLRALPKPVLGLVHGPCAGAGLSLALACDLLLAADNCKFNLAYAGIGLSPDGSSSYFLPRHVGLKRATEIFMTGKNMTSQEALDLGLINRIVPAQELLDQGLQMAQMLAMGPTIAFAHIKELLNQSLTNNLHDQLALETQLFCKASRSQDFRTGVKSFLAKEMPLYQGK